MRDSETPDPVLLRALAQIGRTESFDQIAALFHSEADLQHARALVRRGWSDKGLDLTSGGRDEDVEGLIKTLVYAERWITNWNAGSVHPSIHLFSYLAQRWPRERQDTLADWILAVTQNDYLPYGSMRPHATSVAELRVAQAAVEQGRLRRRQRLEQEERDRERARRENATRNLRGAVRRGDMLAVRALILRGADSTAVDADGVSAADLARRAGRADILNALGLDPTSG
jgi:hypothetical protein